ncbi:MAG TPA: hydroxysqualene dehydroxylase HpnE [Usitatibacteraceae bacterium]|nr:hydroxysqualene dehydroxylase HpnE [Usitatibacteraceae bacterium]
MRRVAIVGAGYAGMAAALTVAGKGGQVSVFETARQLGGRARRVDYGGETLDNGQHILSGAYTVLLSLMAQVGVPANALRRVPLGLFMPPAFCLQAPRWPAPWHLVGALACAQGLSVTDRIAAIRLLRALQRSGFAVEPDQTVAQLLARHHQPDRLNRYLWEPLTVSALNTPIERASANVLAHVLRDTLGAGREASDLLLPQIDLGELFPEPAARWLEARGHIVRRGCRVRSVETSADASYVTQTDHAESFDAVILAVAPQQLASIGLPAELPVIELPVEPIVTMYLKFDGPVRLSRPMVGQSRQHVHWFFDRRELSTGVAQPDGLIAAVISAASGMRAADSHALQRSVLSELQQHTGTLPKLKWAKLVNEKFATFACTPSVETLRPPTATALPGLYLAGDYVASDYPGTLETAVRNGVAAGLAAMQPHP